MENLSEEKARNRKKFLEEYEKYKRTPSWYVVSNILEGTPVMWPDSIDYAEWRHNLAEKLNIPATSIIVVGSSRTGYSLNTNREKDRLFSSFCEESDIDVAIVDSFLFEKVWKRFNEIFINGKVNSKLKSNEVFYRKMLSRESLLIRSDVMDVVPDKEAWANVAEDDTLKLGKGFYGNEIVFKIYRTHEAILRYHIDNVQKVYRNIISSEDS
ncbi:MULTISPECIES: hypothetical protein [Rothia]|jgi:hypothetical protein|uniref:hypothetical protein n=1 Tax=Rothia TaxID=32207 RepID=UPI00244694EA|nr:MULTISPECIES: hypothetical protein [Rothia]